MAARSSWNRTSAGPGDLPGDRPRFSVRYFLIAVLFIVFDVETVFLFPWAIRFKQLGWFGAIEMAVFLAILIVGYVYAWKRKVLSWV